MTSAFKPNSQAAPMQAAPSVHHLLLVLSIALAHHAASIASAQAQPVAGCPPEAVRDERCSISGSDLRARELRLLDAQWQPIAEQLPKLASAQIARPFPGSGDQSVGGLADDGKYRSTCRALGDDLASGRFDRWVKPQVSLRDVGSESFSQAWEALESQCKPSSATSPYLLRQLAKPAKGASDRWLQTTGNGHIELRFYLDTPAVFVDIASDRCLSNQRIPNYFHRDKGKPHRIETNAVAVVHRGSTQLVGLELGVAYGWSSIDKSDPYGDALMAPTTWLPDPNRPGGFRLRSIRSPKGQLFIGAFITPSPWLRPANSGAPGNDPNHQLVGEPCVWLINQ
jgi:hypothetical protein